MSASVANPPLDPTSVPEVDAKKLYRKITWRLIPYIFILYILAYLDRVNVGYAVTELKGDLRLADSVFGLGAGIYFLGQFCFDLPSNLLLAKVGPRIWIARIMISWGLVATLMTLMQGPRSFLLLRFLLGVTEAGFFPGIILYLTYWFPSRERAQAVAKFMTATSIASLVGGFVAHSLMRLDGIGGLHGWQWLFLSEGIPTILMGFSVLSILKDHPDDAPWLTVPERQWLDKELERDRAEGGASTHDNLLDAFKMPMVWVLAGVFALDQIGVYTVNFWMPDMLTLLMHGGVGAAAKINTSSLVALLSTIPYAAAVVCTVLVGWNSDRTFERRWHIAGCFLLSAAGFSWASYTQSVAGMLCAMSLAAVGYWSMMGPFWALPTRVLGGRGAAGGVAIITMIGSLGGFAGPYLTGWFKQHTHSFSTGLLVVAGLAVVGAGLVLVLQRTEHPA
jgi:ACS family tartrate transporter-like MFS transporter